MTLRFSTRAGANLEAIFDWIAKDNPEAAARTIQQITSAISTLLKFPNRGRPGRKAETRELVLTSWIIIYQVKGGVLNIVTIFYGARRF